MNFAGSVSYRPVRIGFLVPPDDLPTVIRVARLTACLWGGRYNPIIPFFEKGGERWLLPHHRQEGIDVARGYIDFFEPDVLVESTPGMAESMGWNAGESYLRMPRIVPIEDFFEADHRNDVEFATGVDMMEVMAELYDSEFRFERRHKQPFARVEEVAGDAYFDVVIGRYPSDARLEYLGRNYEEIFSPETLPPDASTALRQLEKGLYGPLWLTRHGLQESLGRGNRDDTLYVFDPTNAGDVADYWNFRLVERHVLPINVNWFAEFASFMRNRIEAVHRPIPGNPYGTKFHSEICFASSIIEERRVELIREYLAGLPDGAFYSSRDPFLWQRQGRGRERRETKILASSEPTSFDVEANVETSIQVPAPSPPFLNRTKRYRRARWMNVIVPRNSFRGEGPAIVYPTNLWSPSFPRLAVGERSRVGREGWIVQSDYAHGSLLLHLETGREAIINWFKAEGIEAKPSEEGQIAAQVIAAAGGLLPSGMFADRKTLALLGEMAESHAEVSRGGKRLARATPDRSKHINTVRQHFDDRVKRSFGYWNHLDYFLERSVFRAGLRVPCPVCAHQNWLDLDALSYRPTCTRCLKEFAFSQKPAELSKVDWFYRVIGPFAAPDHARGGYSVALTLRTIADPHDDEMTWSTGLTLKELNCEVDFVAWHRGGRMLNEERDEPQLVFGEAKSFGRNAINDDAVASLRKIAERFPGAVLVVSTLREPGELTLAEIARLRALAFWGREKDDGEPGNPLIVLTAVELFAEHGVRSAWEQLDGEKIHSVYDFHDLHTLSDLTLERYLGLAPRWEPAAAAQSLPAVKAILGLVRLRSEARSA